MRLYYCLAIFCLIIFVSVPSDVLSSEKCGNQTPCVVGDRSYYARVPDGWDGESPLPVLLHFHGWMRTGRLIVNHRRIAGATRPRGVLLLAPNGNGRTWNFWRPGTPDVSFASSVLEDAARRWSIDESMIFVSGYSYGSAMAWRFACSRGDIVHSLLAVSGTIPDQTEDCVSAVNVRHVHGTRDNVMDYPFDSDGGIEGAVRLWLTHNGCPDSPTSIERWQAVKILEFFRHRWDNCSTSKTVILDMHKHGHFIPRFWFARQLDELLPQKS